jgi:hypothetical protein
MEVKIQKSGQHLFGKPEKKPCEWYKRGWSDVNSKSVIGLDQKMIFFLILIFVYLFCKSDSGPDRFEGANGRHGDLAQDNFSKLQRFRCYAAL